MENKRSLYFCACLVAVLTLGSEADSQVSHTVIPGDNLWDLSARYLDTPLRWREICDLNYDLVQDCETLESGWVLSMPLDSNTSLVDQAGEDNSALEAATRDIIRVESAVQRNFASGSDRPGSTDAGWFQDIIHNGMDLMFLESGTTEDGLPYATYRVFGPSTHTFFGRIYDPGRSNISFLAGGVATGSMNVEIISNSGSTKPSIALVIGEYNSDGFVGSTLARASPTSDGSNHLSITRLSEASGASIMNLNIILLDIHVGSVVDIVFRIAGLKFEVGGKSTGYVAPIYE